MKTTTLIVAALALAVAGCMRKPVETGKSDNAEIPVDRLFTKDGCTVYRFVDGGNSRYFVRCDGAASSSTGWNESCGKSCSRPVDIPTVYVGRTKP